MNFSLPRGVVGGAPTQQEQHKRMTTLELKHVLKINDKIPTYKV